MADHEYQTGAGGREETGNPLLEFVQSPPSDLMRRLDADLRAAGDPLPDTLPDGMIGATMFDTAGSEDGTVTVLLPQANLQLAPSQALVRIKSRHGRSYLGTIVACPIDEPARSHGEP